MTSILMKPTKIAGREVRNRLVRSGTSETMAEPNGTVTGELVDLYETLGRSSVGLIITGHLYVHPRGQYAPLQMSIADDARIQGLSRLSSAVTPHGSRFFAQLAHAGSQSRIPGVAPLAPSPVPNALTGRMVDEASKGEIEETIEAFGLAARRAVESGFDGVHIHAANGYLISEFASPIANRRSDKWGGSAAHRDQFPLAVVRAIREQVPADFPVTMKIGFADAPENGLGVAESVERAGKLVDAGLDGIEVSVGVMERPTDSCGSYVAVDRKRAMDDLLIHRLFSKPGAEAYFQDSARALKASVDTKVILVGGMRTTETMEEAIESGDADFIAMARPFIREPDIARQILDGRTGRVDCTSCNICLQHEGHHSLRCWRKPRRRLLQHALYRFTGGFKRGEIIKTH